MAAVVTTPAPPVKNSVPERHAHWGPPPVQRRGRKHTASETHGARKRVSPLNSQKLKNRQQAVSETEDYFIDDEIYDSFDLEEPFSSSDEDEDSSRMRKSSRAKFVLPLPRRRIRTLSGTIPPVGYAPRWGGPSMCVGCMEFFDLPSDIDKYSQHLLSEHQIVISDIRAIVDLKRYIEYWRHAFTERKVQDVFPKITPSPGEKYHGMTEFYYLMSEKVKEDSKIRERLAMRRLEEVLSCQQREREDHSFTRQCLFCRYRVKGNRSKLVHHLFTIHHLNLGSPDNMVFVNEYLDTLRHMLDSNQCLHCEKFFPDHNTLMDHMRKKQHREVNPKNAYYDKFYVINYLELGKKWLDVLAEDFEDSMQTFADSDDEDEDEAWEEFLEDNDEEMEIVVMCLFCEHTTKEPNAAVFVHMKDEHGFDIAQIASERNYTFYHQVKLVNYIRRMTYQRHCFVCSKTDFASPDALRLHLNEDNHLGVPAEESFMSDENLIPYFSNDFLLFFLEDPEILPEPPVWQGKRSCTSISEEDHPQDPGDSKQSSSVPTSASSITVNRSTSPGPASATVPVVQEIGELNRTVGVPTNPSNLYSSACIPDYNCLTGAQFNPPSGNACKAPSVAGFGEEDDVFGAGAVDPPVPGSFEDAELPIVSDFVSAESKPRKTSGAARARKISSWREPPPIIPEDPPLIGDILDDPVLREELM